MFWFVFLYIACGALLTGWMFWREWNAQHEHGPLVEDGEWLLCVMAVAVMVLTWPFWLFAWAEAKW